MSVRVIDEGAALLTDTPYSAQFVSGAKNIGGKWDAGKRMWRFKVENRDLVYRLLDECYGWTPDEDPSELKTIVVDADDLALDDSGQRLMLNGIAVATRYERDSPVRFAENVVLVSGGFDGWGGSRAHPRIDGWEDGTRLRISGVNPRQLEWLRERGSGFTVVDDASPSLAELQAERERLKERLAQVERMIAERSGDGTDEG